MVERFCNNCKEIRRFYRCIESSVLDKEINFKCCKCGTIVPIKREDIDIEVVSTEVLKEGTDITIKKVVK